MVQFLNNKGFSQGGAVFIVDDQTTDIKFEDCKFEGNSAKVSGGAISVSEMSNLSILNGIFLNNKADSSGSAIYFKKT